MQENNIQSNFNTEIRNMTEFVVYDYKRTF